MKFTKSITFDMDGTLADFYGVENWIDYLNNEDITSFIVIDRTRYSAVPLTTILTVLYTKLEEPSLFGTIARRAMILYAKKDYDTLDNILTTSM